MSDIAGNMSMLKFVTTSGKSAQEELKRKKTAEEKLKYFKSYDSAKRARSLVT